jgi:hypothetical protein
VTLLLLSIGILNACLEAKKLKESCAGVIGAMVLATFGLAAAVVIRLPCVPLQPNYDGLMQVTSELILAIPMTLLSLASLGSCAAVFIAGAGAGRSLWLLFTCGVLVSAFLCLSVVRALVHKAAPYELLTLIVPQWLFLTFLTVIMKFKTSWQARLLPLTQLPGFLLLLLLLHLPPIVATLLCLPTELVA